MSFRLYELLRGLCGPDLNLTTGAWNVFLIVTSLPLSGMVRNYFSFYSMKAAQAIVGSVSEGWSLHGLGGGEKAYLDTGIHICCPLICIATRSKDGLYPLMEMTYPSLRMLGKGT